MGRPRTNPAERFWAKVRLDQDTDCLLWSGYISPNGYGQFSLPHRLVYAHRFAYELGVGTIPGGMVIDHLCRTRACVNAKHLEVVSNKENLLRGAGFVASNARKTHCVHGHVLAGDNLVSGRLKHGWRECLSCDRARRRATGGRK